MRSRGFLDSTAIISAESIRFEGYTSTYVPDPRPGSVNAIALDSVLQAGSWVHSLRFSTFLEDTGGPIGFDGNYVWNETGLEGPDSEFIRRVFYKTTSIDTVLDGYRVWTEAPGRVVFYARTWSAVNCDLHVKGPLYFVLRNFRSLEKPWGDNLYSVQAARVIALSRDPVFQRVLREIRFDTSMPIVGDLGERSLSAATDLGSYSCGLGQDVISVRDGDIRDYPTLPGYGRIMQFPEVERSLRQGARGFSHVSGRGRFRITLNNITRSWWERGDVTRGWWVREDFVFEQGNGLTVNGEPLERASAEFSTLDLSIIALCVLGLAALVLRRLRGRHGAP